MTDTEKRLAEIREREPYTDINGRKIKFGDKVVNGYASQDNPTRCGIFVQWTACNGATCAKCTDGHGHFWNVLHDKNDLLEVIECREDEADKLCSEIDRLTAELATYEASSISCCECGGKVVEFTVPNDIWNMVMRPDGKETNREYICLDCWHKALKNKLDELTKNVQEEFDIGSGYYKKWQKADAQLAALKEAQRWIPAGEPPKIDGKYLCCVQYCRYHAERVLRYSTDRGKVDEYDMRGKGPGFYDYDSECGYYCVNSVTHWMPLPAQPEKEAE